MEQVHTYKLYIMNRNSETNEKSVLKIILLVTRWYINRIIDFNNFITTVIRFFPQQFTLL